MYHLYIIENTKDTYVGITTDYLRRRRQHNCEIKGGAYKTTSRFKRGDGKWKLRYVLSGFPDKRTAMQFEWRMWHFGGTPRKTTPMRTSLRTRLQHLESILSMDRPTKSAPLTSTLSLRLRKFVSSPGKKVAARKRHKKK